MIQEKIEPYYCAQENINEILYVSAGRHDKEGCHINSYEERFLFYFMIFKYFFILNRQKGRQKYIIIHIIKSSIEFLHTKLSLK